MDAERSMSSTAPECRVSEYLAANPNADVCDTCLTERTGLPSAIVADQATVLARTAVYQREVRICAECGAEGLVTRAFRYCA